MNTKTLLVLVVIASVLVLEATAIPVKIRKESNLPRRFHGLERRSLRKKGCNRGAICSHSNECSCEGKHYHCVDTGRLFKMCLERA
ncbi:hypothetical protein AC249_AIPGENE5210 [Exaiptasia diaphana]|nr:hypothetical protein AC249_AIPGENE5210 [Exaiptasia diaphana]